jgi:hypothetical protein
MYVCLCVCMSLCVCVCVYWQPDMSKEPSEEDYSKAAELKAAALEAASTGMSLTAELKHVRALTKPLLGD